LTSGVYVYERPLDSSAPNWPFWTNLLSDTSSTTDPAFAGGFGRISVSLTANRISSTFFAFYSYLWSGDRVRLARLPGSGGVSVSDFSGITGGIRALTDVTAVGAPDGDSFKIGYTPLTDSHGNTYVRTGTWSASSGAPSLGVAALISSLGRSANVVYFDRATATGGAQGINSLYEVKVSDTSYRLDVDYFEPAPPPPSYPSCSDYEGLYCSWVGRERPCTDNFGDPGMCTCERYGRNKGDMAWSCF
jgi:hypothetical protein